MDIKDWVDEEAEWFDEHQEEICDYCEKNIIEGSSNSSTFQCEGRFCTEAYEDYRESYEKDEEDWQDKAEQPKTQEQAVEEVKQEQQVELDELEGLVDDILNTKI